MTVTVRAAKVEDVPRLQEMLQEQSLSYEQQDLLKTIAFVVEYDGQLVGFSACRLTWQVEPVLLDETFRKHAPHFAQQKATYLLIREADRYIADREKNRTGIYSYFCSIKNKTMQKLAKSFGMWPVYLNCKMFGREV